jgi:glucose 1-dehydrogenase
MKLPIAFLPVVAIRNIRVVGVGPGGGGDADQPGHDVKDLALMQKVGTAIPMGRMATPEKIGHAVAFLAGDGASNITATTVLADGGLMHQRPGI